MSQLGVLIWLKWRLFRNALRSRRATVSRVAGLLSMAAVLAFALLLACGLGFVSYQFMLPPSKRPIEGFDASLLLLFIFSFVYFMWAVVPLGMSGGDHFDPGRLLLYPISLRKLFAIDLLSELLSLSSILTVPTILAISIAAGLASGRMGRALLAGLCAMAFGVSLARLLSASVGALMRRRRTRGETLLALVGALIALSGVWFGQFAKLVLTHVREVGSLRWTPPGAVAVALTRGVSDTGAGDYASSVLLLFAYCALLVWATYRIARRSALGSGGSRRSAPSSRVAGVVYEGWRLPLLSSELSAVVEKELRYAMRNAQLRTLALMPLILICLRLFRSDTFGGRGVRGLPSAGQGGALDAGLGQYGEGLMLACGVLYVFTILSSISCNSFGFDDAGMRSLVLSPLERRTILLGKNIALATLAGLLSALLVALNQLVFRDVTLAALAVAALSFVLFAATHTLVGNWLSINFPKRLRFGKRLNTSGVTGLLLIPLLVVMGLPLLVSLAAGYFARSLTVKYATLALFAAVAVALYTLLIKRQGRALARREQDILATVSARSES